MNDDAWADAHLEMDYEDRVNGGLDVDEVEDRLFNPYCDYCEQEGHSFNKCPRRDDSFEEYDEN